MPGLNDTLAGLARASRAAALSADDDAGMVPVAGFGANPGGLRMLTYAPPGCGPGAPLVVVLHGCTQGAGAHADAAGWLTLADRLGFQVLAPEQQVRNNPKRCFNWFEPGDIARGSGEAASIRAMIAHRVRTHGADPERVFVTGLSAGGAMAAVMLAAYPETFAAGAVIAGLPYGAATSVGEALAVMRRGAPEGRDLSLHVRRAAPAPRRIPRLSVWHGEADHTVAPGNAHVLARQWAGVHGLGPQPDRADSAHGRTRSVWRGADGEVLIELNLLAGLGHGMPLAASGADPLGRPAPFMLEAGVASALEIARFWGLAPPADGDVAGRIRASAGAPAKPGVTLGEQVLGSVAAHVPAQVQAVIARALGAAGLMR